MMFQRATGLNYYSFLQQMHKKCLMDWYFEVGSRRGQSVAPARGKTITVDPFFKMNSNVIQSKPCLLAYQTTSDDFFASGTLDALNIKLSLSFLDGMHLFDYLLRDFINTEAKCDPKGVIMLHDICPWTERMAKRDYSDIRPGEPWTGDVWKVVSILKELRPDLDIMITDCAPSGLAIIRNLDPKSKILDQEYDKLVKKWMDINMDEAQAKTYYDSFDYTKGQDLVDQGFPFLKKIQLDEKLAKKPVFVSP